MYDPAEPTSDDSQDKIKSGKKKGEKKKESDDEEIMDDDELHNMLGV